MADPSGQAVPSPSHDLHRVKTRPVGFRGLPNTTTPPAPAERRDHAKRELLVHRIRAEFREMPGLRLTVRQAARLFGTSEDACARILSVLSGEGFLRCTTDGCYVLLAAGP